ncbi:porin [Rhodohalobacter halophilus]|uniref:porin n=1 Tax=Rhodohalobacter halophilus TaxID=1812810 RepID=UPI000A078397|nr:porin [Rhodohalobacter halophilus]
MELKKLYVTALLLMGTFLLNISNAATIQAQGIQYENDSGWGLDVTGQLPVFINLSKHDSFSSDGGDQFSSRIMSGFNPANITFSVSAPAKGGISVRGIFQINHHLQGAGIQNDGLFEGRIADIEISGEFGTVNMGKGFGIFGSSAIADAGSAMGVGRFGGPDAADATLGRIGSGYTYANFNPRITYTTPSLGGLTLKAGFINPEKPDGPSDDIETTMPRFEGQANYFIDLTAGTMDIWVGGMAQSVDVVSQDFEYTISGWDAGTRINIGGLQLTGAYSQTSGVGADGLIGLNLSGSGLDQAEVKATQWYTEAVYTLGDIIIGGSYGEGSQDANSTVIGSSPDITNQLLMVFTRYKVTDQLTLIGEVQNFESDAQSNYRALIAGMQFNF